MSDRLVTYDDSGDVVTGPDTLRADDAGADAAVQSQPVEQPASTAGQKPAVPTGPPMRFTATAYALTGKTASGTPTRRGIVAADPDVLPLGTRIRVSGAGKHSGEYVVEDTGGKVLGRTIDLWMESTQEALRFGERSVQVEILELARRK